MAKMMALEEENKRKDERIQFLESRVDDLEQYSRKQNIVIAGLPSVNRDYADVVADRESDDQVEELGNVSLEKQVLQFCNNKLKPRP